MTMMVLCILTCMCFLMAMEEKPVRPLISVMATIIPALNDMVMVVSKLQLQQKKMAYQRGEFESKWMTEIVNDHHQV